MAPGDMSLPEPWTEQVQGWMDALHYYLDMTVAGAHIRVHMDKIRREYPLVVPRLEAGKRPVDRTYEWSIVLTNVGSSPARNIRYVLEPASGVSGEGMGVGKKEIPLLQGYGARERIGVLPRASTAARLSLRLTWSDEEGSKEQYSEIEVAHDGHPFAMRVKAETGPAHVQPTRPELPRTMPSAHSERPRGHAFISYVREDSERVARLVEELEAAEIKVWLDKEDIAPGQDWKAEIRHAITDGALAFVACFSLNSAQRNKSYQNEELLLAAEEIRLRPLGQRWYFPVRFDECDPPAYDIGAGRTLKSIQHSDLFGKDWERSAKRLVRAIVESQSSSSTLRLTVPPPPAEVSTMPIRKAAEVLGRLTREQAASILAELSTERSAARLAAMSVPVSAEVVTFIGEETGADILSAMEPAQAAKLLAAMEQTEAVERIHFFSSETVLRLLPFIEGRDQKRLLTGRSDDELTRVELQELARSKRGNLFLLADSSMRTSLVREADPEVAADWLRLIHIQHAADLLTQIDTGRAAEILWDFGGDELTLWFKVLGARPAGLRILDETGPQAIWSRLTSMNGDQAGAIADGLRLSKLVEAINWRPDAFEWSGIVWNMSDDRRVALLDKLDMAVASEIRSLKSHWTK